MRWTIGVALILLSYGVWGDILYVSPNGNDANDGRSWATAKRTIANALANSPENSEVWVAAGTYSENGAFVPNRVSLYGGFAGNETSRDQRNPTANPTIINNLANTALPALRLIASEANPMVNSTIDGFIFEGSRDVSGSAMFIQSYVTDSVVISNNIFRNNQAGTLGNGIGGAVNINSFSNPVFRNNRFENNLAGPPDAFNNAGLQGGAIYLNYFVAPTFENNVFIGNKAGREGGAIYGNNNANPVFRNNRFENNQCVELTPTRPDRIGTGGACFFNYQCTVSFDGDEFINNQAERAGAVFFQTQTNATMRRCLIKGNRAINPQGDSETHSCGGVMANYLINLTLENCLIVDNEAPVNAGVYCQTGITATIRNCTFVGTQGETYPVALRFVSGCCATTGLVQNCLFAFNAGVGMAGDGTGDPPPVGSTVTAVNNLMFGNQGGNFELFDPPNRLIESGTLTSDPLLISLAAGDYHLSASSPAINAGAIPDAPTNDYDGRTRTGNPDIGAYEFHRYRAVLANWVGPNQDGDLSSLSVNVELRNGGNQNFTRPLAADGTFSLGRELNISAGVYDVALLIPRGLRKGVSGFNYPASTLEVTLINGDTNSDNRIDDRDLSNGLKTFGASPPANPLYDLNGDGTVNNADLLIMLLSFGNSGDA